MQSRLYVPLSLMTGCIIDPVTGQSRPDPRVIGALGAVAGGVGGAYAGKAIGGKTGRVIGAVAGTALGGAAAYFITDYLNTREQQQYQAKLNQQMRATSANVEGTDTWVNANRTKVVNTGFSQEMPLQQVSANFGNQIPLNQQRIASLPSNTTCRVADSRFQVNGQQASTPGIYCRDAYGDYIKVDDTVA
jgi:outer membrane lipoprotein SlyB